MGCRLEVEYAESITSIKNNRCKNGIKYAQNEIYDPRRMVTTTVMTTQPIKYLPVKTATPVPKNLVKNVIDELKTVTVKHPVKIGDIITQNICGTGINIIAAMNS